MPQRSQDGLLVPCGKIAFYKQPHQVAVPPQIAEVGFALGGGGDEDFVPYPCRFSRQARPFSRGEACLIFGQGCPCAGRLINFWIFFQLFFMLFVIKGGLSSSLKVRMCLLQIQT